jgi:hypothetical protein
MNADRPDSKAMIRESLFVTVLATFAAFPAPALAQTSKSVNVQTQFWGSINSTTRITDRYGAIADFHVRRNDVLADPSFYFVRFGANCWLTEQVTAALGYAHMWKAPAWDDWSTWTDEDRIYEQLQFVSKAGRVGMLQRLRNEQRWIEQVSNDTLTGSRASTDRVRYLLSFTIPVSDNSGLPSLVLSDEIHLQFGSSVVYNTFEQNRIFVGIKKTLAPDWSFDLGYMRVYQQKASGYEYDLNHTIRWFFYYTPDLRKRGSGAAVTTPVSEETGD